MHENCTPNDCPVNARVDSIEKEFNRYRESSGTTHKEMFQRIGALEKAEAAQEKHFETVNEKLDKLIEWQENQRDKPARRWDGLVDKALWLIVCAVIAYLLAQMGLPA